MTHFPRVVHVTAALDGFLAPESAGGAPDEYRFESRVRIEGPAGWTEVAARTLVSRHVFAPPDGLSDRLLLDLSLLAGHRHCGVVAPERFYLRALEPGEPEPGGYCLYAQHPPHPRTVGELVASRTAGQRVFADGDVLACCAQVLAALEYVFSPHRRAQPAGPRLPVPVLAGIAPGNVLCAQLGDAPAFRLGALWRQLPALGALRRGAAFYELLTELPLGTPAQCEARAVLQLGAVLYLMASGFPHAPRAGPQAGALRRTPANLRSLGAVQAFVAADILGAGGALQPLFRIFHEAGARVLAGEPGPTAAGMLAELARLAGVPRPPHANRAAPSAAGALRGVLAEERADAEQERARATETARAAAAGRIRIRDLEKEIAGAGARIAEGRARGAALGAELAGLGGEGADLQARLEDLPDRLGGAGPTLAGLAARLDGLDGAPRDAAALGARVRGGLGDLRARLEGLRAEAADLRGRLAAADVDLGALARPDAERVRGEILAQGGGDRAALQSLLAEVAAARGRLETLQAGLRGDARLANVALSKVRCMRCFAASRDVLCRACHTMVFCGGCLARAGELGLLKCPACSNRDPQRFARVFTN